LNSNLKTIIKDRGIKVTWLSERSGVSRNSIHVYMDGGIPALDKAYAIAEALDISVYDIWEKLETERD
jgi:lambda repressor-like predicted transcriptional regulator